MFTEFALDTGKQAVIQYSQYETAVCACITDLMALAENTRTIKVGSKVSMKKRGAALILFICDTVETAEAFDAGYWAGEERIQGVATVLIISANVTISSHFTVMV